MQKILDEFEHLLKNTIQEYLEKYDYLESSKTINPSIGSYKIVFSRLKNNINMHISFEFSLHHYDLYDGIFVFIYTNNEVDFGYRRLSLNEIVKTDTESRKIYSPLVLNTTIPSILNDLRKISDFFIEKIDLTKYNKLLSEKIEKQHK